MESFEHAEIDAKELGGTSADYLLIHKFIDSVRGVVGPTKHRLFTHTTWFAQEVLPLKFGEYIKVKVKKDGKTKKISVIEIGIRHISQDFGGPIPTMGDWLLSLKMEPWMENGLRDHAEPEGLPPSVRGEEKIIREQPPSAPRSLRRHPFFPGRID